MAGPNTSTTPDFTGVIDQRFFMAPLGGPQNPVSYLDRFPDELYNKSVDSHLVKFMYALLGPAGVGWLRKNYLDARLKLEDFGVELTDLDKFYGNPIKFGRVLEELYEDDPSGMLDAESWERIRAKDARYRNRALDYVTGARAGGTPLGMRLVARSGLGHEVEIFERYKYLYDSISDDPIGIPNYGSTSSTEEMVVIPRRELPQSEIQTLTITGTATAGSFTLTFPVGETSLTTTQPINYNASAEVVQLLLEAIPTIGKGNIAVSGGPLPDQPLEILFTGDLAYRDVPQLTADYAGITGTSVGISIVTSRSGVDQTDEVVSIPPRDQYYAISALSRIKPVTTIVTFGQGSGLIRRQNWNVAASSSVQHEVVRYVTGQSGVEWPSSDSSHWIVGGEEMRAPRGTNSLNHAYQGFHNIKSVSAYTELALDDLNYLTSTDILSSYNNEHIGNYTSYHAGLYPILNLINPEVQLSADRSLADYAEPLSITESTGGTSPVGLVNGIYPEPYRNLTGVPEIKYKDDQFWSSVERTQGDDYLEIDLGSPQAVNYLYFEATQKPYDIELAFDVLDLAPARTWKTVTLDPNRTSVTRLDYSVAARNPWKTVEIHFTNDLGNLVFTRFLRIKLSRRSGEEGSPFTIFDGSLEQYGIEVKNLRVGRNVA